MKNSTITGAGKGLYATREFMRGELITEYVGEIISREEARKRLERGEFHYLGTLVPGLYEIDGIRSPIFGVGAASLINHASSSNANVRWCHIEDRKVCFRRLFAKATRDIHPGEEILINYGKTFWDRHKRWHLAVKRGLHLLPDTSDEEEDDRYSPSASLSSFDSKRPGYRSTEKDYAYLYETFHSCPLEPPSQTGA